MTLTSEVIEIIEVGFIHTILSKIFFIDDCDFTLQLKGRTVTTLNLTDKETEVFADWLHQRERSLSEEVFRLQELLFKVEGNNKSLDPQVLKNTSQDKSLKTISAKKENNSLSWVNMIKKELERFSHPVPSGDIVNRLLQQPALQTKGKRFITKAVTSKLWLLQERGEVIKTKEDGRFVYSLKK